jgi:hypothetical protein
MSEPFTLPLWDWLLAMSVAGRAEDVAVPFKEGFWVGEAVETGAVSEALSGVAATLVTCKGVTGAGWFSGKYLARSAGVRESAEYSMVTAAFLHRTFAPSLSTESKGKEVPLAKDKVTGLLSPAALD